MKLHSLLQTTSAPRRDEACYLLGKLETPLRRSLDSKSEIFSWLVPIIRTLMDQCYETLQLQQFLPSLPPTNGSPTFYEDFQLFCTTPEWRGFIEKHVGASGGDHCGVYLDDGWWVPSLGNTSLLIQVQPTMAQFEMDTFARSHDLMSNFWNACYDAMMSSSQRREQEKAASRKLFQVLPAPCPWGGTLGTPLSWGHSPHPWGVTLCALYPGECSSRQGCHPGNVLLYPGVRLLTPRMSCREYAPHSGDVILGMCSSP